MRHADTVDRITDAFKDYATYEDLARCLAKYGLSPQTVALDYAKYEGLTNMSPTEVETILKFLIEQLPEDKLAELDARMLARAAPRCGKRRAASAQ